MLVWVSMWDPAVQRMLRGHVVVGEKSESLEHGNVSRRLDGKKEPCYVLAMPIQVGSAIEAIVELGRFGAPFAQKAEYHVSEIMVGAKVKVMKPRSWLPAFPPVSFWACRPIVP